MPGNGSSRVSHFQTIACIQTCTLEAESGGLVPAVPSGLQGERDRETQ